MFWQQRFTNIERAMISKLGIKIASTLEKNKHFLTKWMRKIIAEQSLQFITVLHTTHTLQRWYKRPPFHHPAFPSTMCFATSRGSWTPFMRNSVIPLIASMQASNGEKQTYQLAQKKPIGHARNHSTRNQMIAHRMFMINGTLKTTNKMCTHEKNRYFIKAQKAIVDPVTER